MFMFMQKLTEFCIIHSNDILHVQYNVQTLLVVNASQTSILPSWSTHTHRHGHHSATKCNQTVVTTRIHVVTVGGHVQLHTEILKGQRTCMTRIWCWHQAEQKKDQL